MDFIPLSVLPNVSKSKIKRIVDLTLKMWMSAFIYKLPVFLKLIHATYLVEMYNFSARIQIIKKIIKNNK